MCVVSDCVSLVALLPECVCVCVCECERFYVSCSVITTMCMCVSDCVSLVAFLPECVVNF